MWRDPRLRGLSNDHHQALVLASQLIRARTPEQQQEALDALVARFEPELDPHFVVEEEMLLEPLRAHGELALIQRTEEDHAFLREGAARAKAGKSIDVKAYGERLRDHVRFEERELFERCQELFPDEILDAVWERAPKLD